MEMTANKTPEPHSHQPRLTVLIPVYQRFDGALRACRSVLDHNRQELESGRIQVVVCDDASPSIDPDLLKQDLAVIHPLINYRRNKTNLGMSANILSMVASCHSFLCTVLTDDDWFEPGALAEILTLLDAAWFHHDSVTSIFSPRYSYLESGEFATISCRLDTSNRLFPSLAQGCLLPLAEAAYILSGYFFRPDCVDVRLWRQHIHNAFFPIIYCASILRTGATLYLDQPLVHHTTQNLCHWEAWGASDQAQQQRLCHDYLEALAVVSKLCRPGALSLKQRFNHHRERCKAFRKIGRAHV